MHEKNKNNKKEGISVMENYAKQLKEQVKQLDKLILEADRRIKVSKAPENKKIVVNTKKTSFQYYEVDGKGKRIYIPKEYRQVVQEVVQHDYNESVKKVLLETRSHINRFLKHYDSDAVENVYNKLCEGRKVFVTPIIPTDEDYVREWKKTHIGQQNSYPMATSYLTEQGEQVRSKSEKILADLFLKHQIPYLYEPQLKLKNGSSIYPDFAVLNLQTRKTIYWEHFGLISDGEYASKALHKLQAYEENGFEIGRDILFTSESSQAPFDIKMVEKKIKAYLL
jgi:hypothetical protein